MVSAWYVLFFFPPLFRLSSHPNHRVVLVLSNVVTDDRTKTLQELKVFRIADSLLDVLACGGPRGQAGSMLVGSRDALHSLERVLGTVGGGGDSVFLKKLRTRMAEVELPTPNTNGWLRLSWPEESSERVLRERDELQGRVAFPDNVSVADMGMALELDEATLAQFTGTSSMEGDDPMMHASGGVYNYSGTVY